MTPAEMENMEIGSIDIRVCKSFQYQGINETKLMVTQIETFQYEELM